MKALTLKFFSGLLLMIVLLTGCEQQVNTPAVEDNNGNLLKDKTLSHITNMELQSAKASTAKYNNIEHAIADGYVDINVVMPNMGHHYLNPEYLNAEFEVDKPEILVYSPHPVTGKMRLVAVEYAVPIALSPDPPEGFTGDDDVWGIYEGVLWTLHAWVWEYNPEGVFNPTNPLIP